MRFLGILILASVLAACGEDRQSERDLPRPVDRGGDTVIRVVGGEGDEDDGGAESSIGSAAAQADLRLRVALERHAFDVGQEIPAVLNLTNAGKFPALIFDPARALTADLEIRVTTPTGAEVVVRQHRKVSEDSLTEQDLVSLERGEGGSATVDLAPALQTAGDGAVGTYEVQIVFTGGHQGKKLSMDVWNRRGTKRAPAAPIEIRLTWPDDLAVAGLTPALGRDVETLLSRVREEGRLTESSLAGLRSHGARVYPLLVRKLALASSRTSKAQAIAWNSYEFLLREGGEAALPALARGGVPDGPLVRMLKRGIEADLAEASSDGAPTVRARDALTDPALSRRLLLTAEWDRGHRENRDTLTIAGDGAARRTRKLRGAESAREGRLGAGALRSLLAVLLEERVWLLEAARPFGQRGEARISLSLVLRPAGGRGPEESLVRLSAWETEATLLHRSLARVLTAVEEAGESIE